MLQITQKLQAAIGRRHWTDDFLIRRTKTDNVFLVLNRPIILRTVSRSYAHGSESSRTLLREAGGRFAFHSGCQFGHVSRRIGPPQQGRG